METLFTDMAHNDMMKIVLFYCLFDSKRFAGMRLQCKRTNTIITQMGRELYQKHKAIVVPVIEDTIGKLIKLLEDDYTFSFWFSIYADKHCDPRHETPGLLDKISGKFSVIGGRANPFYTDRVYLLYHEVEPCRDCGCRIDHLRIYNKIMFDPENIGRYFKKEELVEKLKLFMTRDDSIECITIDTNNYTKQNSYAIKTLFGNDFELFGFYRFFDNEIKKT